MQRVAFILILLASMSGCISQARVAKICATCPVKTEVKDSVSFVTNTVIRDSLVTLPADSAWYRAWLECDSSGRVSVITSVTENTDRTRVEYILRDNVITTTCKVDSAAIALKWAENHTTKQELRSVTQYIEVPVPAKLRPMQRIYLGLGWFFWWLIIAALVFSAGAYTYYRIPFIRK